MLLLLPLAFQLALGVSNTGPKFRAMEIDWPVSEDASGSPPASRLVPSLPAQGPAAPSPGLRAEVEAAPYRFSPPAVDLWVISSLAAGAVLAMPFDVTSHRAIRSWPDPLLFERPASYWGSFLGDGLLDSLVFGTVAVVGGDQGVQTAREGMMALLSVAVVSRTGKLLFRLERPSFDETQKHWFSSWKADAFPGGHTMSAFATAAVMALNYPRAAPLFYGLAAYVAIARVQANTHWLSDDLAGAAVGLLLGYASVEVDRWIWSRWLRPAIEQTGLRRATATP